MKYEDIANTEKFKALLEQIPEEERPKVEEAIRKLATDFDEKFLRPLESLIKR